MFKGVCFGLIAPVNLCARYQLSAPHVVLMHIMLH